MLLFITDFCVSISDAQGSTSWCGILMEENLMQDHAGRDSDFYFKAPLTYSHSLIYQPLFQTSSFMLKYSEAASWVYASSLARLISGDRTRSTAYYVLIAPPRLFLTSIHMLVLRACILYLYKFTVIVIFCFFIMSYLWESLGNITNLLITLLPLSLKIASFVSPN